MMTTGGLSISAPMARGVLKRLKKKNPAACAVATALSVVSNPVELSARLSLIEFKSFADIDPTSFRDVYGYYDENGRRRKGIAHKVVAQAEYGARWAGDLQDVLSRRSESAKVGKFKITENSPNTARITVGPDQRERRKKYVWERVGVQRQLAIGGLAIAGVLGARIHGAISKAGEGSFVTGAKNVVKGTFNRGKNVISKAVGGGEIAPFIPERGPLAKMAEVGADLQKIKDTRTQAAGKAVATKVAKYKRDFPFGHRNEPLHPEDHPEAFYKKPDGSKGRRRMKKVANPAPPTPFTPQSQTA